MAYTREYVSLDVLVRICVALSSSGMDDIVGIEGTKDGE